MTSSGLRLGYACVNTRLPSSARTVRLANATPERLRSVGAENLDALVAILRWNVAHGIDVFRLTSNLIPFASHAVNRLAWWDELGDRLALAGSIAREAAMRLSTHPGQYTVLSSERPHVVAGAVAELEYHARLLEAMGMDASHKVVLHVGSGAAGRREEAFERFADGFGRLPRAAAERLAIENDERWPLDATLELARRLDVPVVFDAFHHTLAPSFPGVGVRELVHRAAETWREGDGRQEVHFSTQAPGKRPGAHADSIDLVAFARFVEDVADLPLDCILEVKDKEQSVLRARELVNGPVPRALPAPRSRGCVRDRRRSPRGTTISSRTPPGCGG